MDQVVRTIMGYVIQGDLLFIITLLRLLHTQIITAATINDAVDAIIWTAVKMYVNIL